MSVTDISQNVWEKTNLHFLSKPPANVPFLNDHHHHHHAPPPPSLICLLLFSQTQKNAVFTGFSKQKQNSRVFFIPLFIIKMKQKDASAVVRLSRQGKKHSYNLLRSRDYRTQSAPWGPAGSPSEGNTAAPETESLCSIKEHFSYVFTLKNKKLKRYSFTGKIHNPKLWNC